MRSTPVITTSWDDGHPLDFRVAELLSRHNVAGTFYIPRHFERETMTEAQMRELSRSFEIGAHTLNHVDLKETDDGVARDEIVGSKAWVEDVTGLPCPMFCPPKGHFIRRDLSLAREANFLGVRTVEMMTVARPILQDGVFVMPTTAQAFPHPRSAYLRNGLRRRSWGNLWRGIIHGTSADWPRVARSLMDLAIGLGGVFHLWGHSWELEEQDQWRRLDDVLKAMGERNGPAVSRTNGALCQDTLAHLNEPVLIG